MIPSWTIPRSALHWVGCLLSGLSGVEKDPCRAGGATDRGGVLRGRDCPHPCPRRTGHRRQDPCRDCYFGAGPDHLCAEAGLMRFGPVPLDQALGVVLAHSVSLTQGRLRKGIILGAAEIALLRAEGVDHVVAARLDAGDVAEDEAASALAAALVPDPLGQGLRVTEAFTGRVNLNATGAGVVEVDAGAVLALNLIDPSITLATLPPLMRVQAGTLVGTVKIIAYGVEVRALQQACAAARAAVRVRPVGMRTASLVLTEVAGQEDKLTAKGRRAVEARPQALGMRLRGGGGGYGVDPDRIGHLGPARHRPRGAAAGGRGGGALRHARRSGQSAVSGIASRSGGGGAAGLCALARAERGGLGAGAAGLRDCGFGGGYCGDGGGGIVEGNPHPATVAGAEIGRSRFGTIFICFISMC